MKRCPTCNRTYTDVSLNFCLEDGTPLLSDAAPPPDPQATIRYDSRETSPPPGDIHRRHTPLPNRADAMAPPGQWSPMPATPPRRKSNAVWWILGGLVVVGIIVVGLAVMILVLASLGSNSNGNTNLANTNARVPNRNSNANAANTNANTNANVNSNANLPSSLIDDFSEPKWGAGNFTFGDIRYENDEYHMRSKEKTYLVMYAPTNDYNTENATVSVTTRSLDGTSPSSGYGLIVHGEKSKNGALEDYALLIFTGSEPQYEIIKHKDGAQTSIVPWTKSKVIRTGTNTNQLEVRAKGAELAFYINGQYVDRITDSENFRRGVAGLYTSDTPEVVFDDLEIKR